MWPYATRTDADNCSPQHATNISHRSRLKLPRPCAELRRGVPCHRCWSPPQAWWDSLHVQGTSAYTYSCNMVILGRRILPCLLFWRGLLGKSCPSFADVHTRVSDATPRHDVAHRINIAVDRPTSRYNDQVSRALILCTRIPHALLPILGAQSLNLVPGHLRLISNPNWYRG